MHVYDPVYEDRAHFFGDVVLGRHHVVSVGNVLFLKVQTRLSREQPPAGIYGVYFILDFSSPHFSDGLHSTEKISDYPRQAP